MNSDIARAVDRVQRSRDARNARDEDRLIASSRAGVTPQRAPEVGARVFDLVTGQEGEIVGRTRQDIHIPAPNQRNG